MAGRCFSVRIAGLAFLLSVGSVERGFAQMPIGMGFRGPGVGLGVPRIPGNLGGYGNGGYSPYGGVIVPYGGGYNYSGYDPLVASAPSAAYFTYGNTSYTTESPSPIPVYAPKPPPFATMPPALPLTALLQVHVPQDAEVWLDGQKMRSTGSRRHYRSPPLDPTKGYAYEIRARWRFEDKPIDDLRHVAIRAGATVLVDFTHLDPLVPRPSTPIPPPAPPKDAASDTPTEPQR